MNEVSRLLKRKERLQKRVDTIVKKKNPTNDELHTLFGLYQALGEIYDHLEALRYDIQG